MIFDIIANGAINWSLKMKYILKYELGNTNVYGTVCINVYGTGCINGLGSLIDSKSQFNCHFDYIFSQSKTCLVLLSNIGRLFISSYLQSMCSYHNKHPQYGTELLLLVPKILENFQRNFVALC